MEALLARLVSGQSIPGNVGRKLNVAAYCGDGSEQTEHLRCAGNADVGEHGRGAQPLRVTWARNLPEPRERTGAV